MRLFIHIRPQTMVWLIVGYIWLYVHRPFEIWTWLAALRIERVYMIATLLVWFASGKVDFGRVFSNVFSYAAFAFAAATTISVLLSPFTNILENHGYEDYMKVFVCYILLMSCIRTEKDLKVVVSATTAVFFIFMAHSYREYLSGRVSFAAGSSRLVGVGVTYSEFNDYGTWIVLMIPLIYPILTLCKKRWHYLFIPAYLLLSLRSAMLTGSRGAFISLCALAVLPILISKHRLKLAPVILIGVSLFWVVMPETMKNRYRTVWDPEISDQANSNARGRLAGFYAGMNNWANYPISGAGFGMHAAAVGGTHQAHNLPGQVAGETGTLGVLAFTAMLGCYVFNHFRVLQNFKILKESGRTKEGLYSYRVSTAMIYCMLMCLAQGASLHNGYRFYWFWFGAFQAIALSILDQQVAALNKEQHAWRYQPLLNKTAA